MPSRPTEGCVRSILTVMRAGLEALDHATLSRRTQLLDVAVHSLPAKGPLRLIVDSTGLSVVGEGEWAAAKHRRGRGTRGWKKLHLGVDRSGVIVAHVLTEATVDDAAVGIDRTARVSRRGPRSSARDHTITDVETLGRREGQKASGYHRQRITADSIEAGLRDPPRRGCDGGDWEHPN